MNSYSYISRERRREQHKNGDNKNFGFKSQGLCMQRVLMVMNDRQLRAGDCNTLVDKACIMSII